MGIQLGTIHKGLHYAENIRDIGKSRKKGCLPLVFRPLLWPPIHGRLESA